MTRLRLSENDINLTMAQNFVLGTTQKQVEESIKGFSKSVQTKHKTE